MNNLNITYEKVSNLVPYDRNARSHSDKDVEAIMASIEEFGFSDPIGLWKDNVIVEGHGRLIAAKKLGMEEVPCIHLDHLTDEQRKAYGLAHNKTAELSSWDFDVLGDELQEITDIDMKEFGFDIESLIEEKECVEQDEIPELPKEPKAKLGDIYQLGDHRLICGDSTDILTIDKLMSGEKAKMLFTSPPYSDMRDYNGGKNLSVDYLTDFIPAFKEYTNYQCINLGIQRKDHEIIQYWDEYIKVAKDAGYKLLAWNVWDKNMCGSIGQQSAFFPIRHEWIFVFGTEFFEINQTVKKKEESINIKNQRKVRQKDGSTKTTTRGDTSCAWKQMESVVQINPEQGSIRKKHPATFPVGLPGEYIKAMTNERDGVIEPFGGSGTTLIACEQLNRKCFICELDPQYVDVIIERWENLTDKKAVLLNGQETMEN